LINSANIPVGFLSLRDLLVGIASLKPQKDINLIISKPSTAVSDEEVQKVGEHLAKFGQKLNSRVAIEKIEVNVEEPKYSSGETAVFNTSLIVTPLAGRKIIAKTKSSSFIDGIQAATEQIVKQERRSGLTRKETQYAGL
jgi:hypothetical protein